MLDQYFFRALNQNDINNINNNRGLECNSGVNISDFDSAVKNALCQVSSGSKTETSSKTKTSWISMTKNFFSCAEEYSIPQMGGFNNAMCRRPIAIISRNAEIGAPSTYQFNNINSTYIRAGRQVLDLGDKGQWPDVKKRNGRYSFRELPCSKEPGDDHSSWQTWIQFQHQNIDQFIWDLAPGSTEAGESFIKRAGKGSKPPLHVLPLRRLISIGMVEDKVPSPHIVCSTSMRYKEVLIANSVSINSIVKVLSLKEIDFLYAFKKFASSGADFSSVLQSVIGNGVASYPYTPNFEVDTVFQRATQASSRQQMDVLQLFESIKQNKRCCLFHFIDATFKYWNLRNPINDHNDISILEDAVIVARIPCGNAQIGVSKARRRLKYDVVLIHNTKNGTIHYYASPGYENVWKSLPMEFEAMKDGALKKILLYYL